MYIKGDKDLELTDGYIFIDKLTSLINEIAEKITPTRVKILNTSIYSKSQILTLNRLHNHRQCFISELADYLSISLPATTGLIKRMVKNNLVKKERDARDRRMVKVKLTQRGRNFFKAVYYKKKKKVIECLKRFKEEDRKNIIKYLSQLGKAIEKVKD